MAKKEVKIGSFVTYEREDTGIRYPCKIQGFFEHNGEPWFFGVDPACNLTTGYKLSAARVEEEPK